MPHTRSSPSNLRQGIAEPPASLSSVLASMATADPAGSSLSPAFQTATRMEFPLMPRWGLPPYPWMALTLSRTLFSSTVFG